MFCPVLVYFDVFFPGVRQGWCDDRFCLQLGSGCHDGIVRNEVWYCGLWSGGESERGEEFGFLDAKFSKVSYIFLPIEWSILDFKLSPCSECCLFSFGWFPAVWFIYTDVSEHSVCSIFKGRCEVILGREGRLIYTGGILGSRKLGPIGNRRGRFRVQEQDVEGVGIKMRSGWTDAIA